MPCLDAPAQFRETVRLTATEQKINGILESCSAAGHQTPPEKLLEVDFDRS
ncbi:Transposase [Caenorhabditis elegans]|uniref:Transposase n=1 Tax=Caenorhabditis elegans TaxID=6239 RepID=I2HA97_CAEEL|nr:Transposase [Caenorhabditis elegans]CCH63804.2 Transposase [Caenorhabditis elegans]|eukprot:NP_001256103.2 Uncharacterized protein CELE_ZC190.10 [Caenorhabditis elegans]